MSFIIDRDASLLGKFAVTIAFLATSSCKIGGSANNSVLSGHTHEEYVERSGDSMDGPLKLPVNGLTVGTSDLSVVGTNLGIGTSRPSASLDIQGPTGNYFKVDALGGTVITGNKVGIGNTSPSTLLNIGATTPTTSANGIQFGTDTSANLYRSAASTIKSDGGVLAASFRTNTGTFDATSTYIISAVNHYFRGGSVAANQYGDFQIAVGGGSREWKLVNQGTSKTAFFVTGGNGAEGWGDTRVGIATTVPGAQLQVGSAGDGTVALANAWNLLSDRRLKKEIKPIHDSLEKITQLKGVTFKWKDGTDRRDHIGLIAQEVNEVFPQAVHETGRGFLSINYDSLISPIIEAIKELARKFSSQDEEIKLLRAEIETLKAQLKKK